MSHLNGIFLIDAPASALNNAGVDPEARTDNAVAVKFIRTPDGRYPYVSSQAIRFWLRTQLGEIKGWSPSPVFRETKIAYTDAEPTKYSEDDLFGYMRVASKSTDEAKVKKREEIAAKSTPVDPDTREVTRVSPFRVGTAVAISPVRIVSDFGTMARAESDPVPHEHQFYRAHLKAPFALDLTNVGTFYVSKRAGYKNLDKNRIDSAKAAGATESKVRGFDTYRLPLNTRRERVTHLLAALGRMEGGAKQTLHLTDTSPAVLVLAICRSGNQPFMRLFGSDELEHTVFRMDVLDEALQVFKDDIQSDLYVGWAKGFLDAERRKLDTAIGKDGKHSSGRAVHVGHPREIAEMFANAIREEKNAIWFD
jgi:CRISPR-associated protein Cst2